MAKTDIQAATVAEISDDVAATLDTINDLTDEFKRDVIGRIENSWYNENVTKVMPEAQNAINGISKGVNVSLASLGRALSRAANAWAEANGAAGYSTRTINENPRKIAGNYKSVGDKGYEGMDTEEIQTALEKGEEIKGKINDAIKKLKAAGQKPGFRGGTMQANLDSVCETLSSGANRAFDLVLDSIANNTGTARKNVIVAKDTTESEFKVEA